MSPTDSADPAAPESIPIPRPRGFRARLFGDLEFARKSLAVLAVVLGVLGPALGFWWLSKLLPDRSLGAALMVLAAPCMLALLAWSFVRPQSPKLVAFLAGALWIAVVFGIVFALLTSPLWLTGIVYEALRLFGEQRLNWGVSLHLFVAFLLCLVPVLGTIVYLIHARRATIAARRAPGEYMALGAFFPIVLSGLAYFGLQFMRERCVRAMLSADTQSALAAADDCRCLGAAVSWQPIVDAWLAARELDPSPEDDACSGPIADAFQRLTGIDLRTQFDDSAHY